MTQRAIKHALTERYYAWEDARRVAVEDPKHRVEVNLNPSDNRYAYTPEIYDVRMSPCECLNTEAIRLLSWSPRLSLMISPRLQLTEPDSRRLSKLSSTKIVKGESRGEGWRSGRFVNEHGY